MLRPQVAWSLAIALIFPGILLGQTPSLTLASGSTSRGGSVSLNLSLATSTGNQPAALEWTLSYAPSDVASIGITAGPAASAAGKTINCSTSGTSRHCLISGVNATLIASGVVAIVNVTLAAGSANTVAISVTGTLGARADGTADTISGAGGSIQVSGTTAGTATFVTTDFASSGWWRGMYGADGATVIGDTSTVPSYVTVTPSGNASYVWSAATGDLRALQKAGSLGSRVAGTWYAAGSFTVDLNFHDTNAHRVAIYVLDWDGAGRSERVDVLDGNNTVLDSRTATNFKNGQYLVWNLSGHVVLRFTNTGPLNAVASGIFFGASPVTTSTAAAFIGGDNTTAGSWKGVYGGDGSNIIGDTAAYPSYVTATPSGNSTFVWTSSTSDGRALVKHASTTDRVAGAWYASSSFSIDLNFHDTSMHRVGIYLLDWDGANTRGERVDILDTSNHVLDTRSAGGFTGGVYLVWNLSSHVIVRITNAGGSNAVLSGIFFGGASSAGTSTATFVKTDTTTGGTWKGVYGADGVGIEADAANYPSYVTVSTAGASTYTWAASSSDARALQQSSSGGRLAACWYAQTSFSVDLNFHDAGAHQVAFYLLDWDGNNHRAERIDILDTNNNVISSQTASAFSNGHYLVWNVTGHVVVRITNTAAPNAVLSGIFFR